MKITKEELLSKVDGFIGDVLTAKIKTPTNRFAFGFIRPLLPTLAETSGMWAKMTATGILDGEGNVDMGLFEKCVKSGFSASCEVKLMGVGFEPKDAEAFFAYVKQGAAQ